MDAEAFFEEMPFTKLVGVEVTSVEEGHVTARVEMREELSGTRPNPVAHGGLRSH